MIEQPDFDFTRPRSRRGDPASSRRAEGEMRASGTLRGQALITLNLIKEFPGRSSKQLSELGTLDRYQIARRLPELEQMKHVRRTEDGNSDCRWFAL